MLKRRRYASARSMLRAHQALHVDALDERLVADLAFVQNKDLDLSIRLGAIASFNALLITAAINPIAASPGAPLSLDAPTQPWETILVCLGIVPLLASALLAIRALLIGEEFSVDGIEGDRAAIAQRLFAAYCLSVDLQTREVSRGVWLTTLGGAISVIAWVWILAEKIL